MPEENVRHALFSTFSMRVPVMIQAFAARFSSETKPEMRKVHVRGSDIQGQRGCDADISCTCGTACDDESNPPLL